ncbi:MAG: serine/threonine-protein kinase, partial [Myxococcota bacterium]
MPPTPTPPRAGAKKRRFPRPFGRYYLERVLSRGGMGEVFLAIVKRLNQRCVIKTIRGDLTGEEEFVGRFADEAKILVRAAHDNIIRYFDAGRVASDYYIAMEWVHGRDLGDVLDRAYERGEPMPAHIGLYVTANLLAGLHYAHELTDEQGRRMGLVHRDISPQNVLIGFDGSVKLIDFGLARTDVLPSRTQGALAVGKYGYMSPEQARHQPLDGRADIYSTGVMLFEVFTGDRLVDEQDQSTLWQRVLNPRHRRPRTVLPGLSPAIDDMIMRAVAVRPEDRFASAKAMATEVNRLRDRHSTRSGLQDYLRYLYPSVDFEAPPLPSLDNLAEGVEDSIIFATSREGARSVFGRGELPIEGTMQIDARDVRRQIDRRRKLARDGSSQSTMQERAQ